MKTTVALVVLMIVVFLMLAVLANVRPPLMASPFSMLAEYTVKHADPPKPLNENPGRANDRALMAGATKATR
jgi:hypothetical protein